MLVVIRAHIFVLKPYELLPSFMQTVIEYYMALSTLTRFSFTFGTFTTDV